MAFPDSPLDLRVELYLGTVLGWVDITGDVYTRDPVSITRGRQDEATTVDPGKCSLTLNNRGGTYSPRNPRSPYYGLLGRNTPIRVSVPASESYLTLDGTSDGIAATGGTPGLGLSAEMDVRVEVTTNWRLLGEDRTIIGQYDGVTGDGWILRLTADGRLSLFVPTAGGSGGMQVFLPTTLQERTAVRATFVADDGTGTARNNIYTAASLDGPWELLADFSKPSEGTILDSALPIEIAPSYTSSSGEPRRPVEGLVHRAEVRSAVDGPIVAAPDFRSLTEGTTSFTDSAGVAWTVGGTASISDRAYRFHGEVSEWPTRWDVSGADVYEPITAAGVLRRLGQGAPSLQSTLRRRIPGGGAGQPGPIAYWPMEEGKHATQAASPLEGVAPLRTSGLTWAANNTLFGSAPLPTLGQLAAMAGDVPPTNTDGWHVDLSYFLEKLPDNESQFIQIRPSGSKVASFEVDVSTAGVRLTARDRDSVVLSTFLYSQASALTDLVGVWNRMQLFTTTSGSTTYMYAFWRDVVTGDVAYAFVTVPDSSPGRVARVSASWGSGLSGMAVGHLGVWDVGAAADADGFNPTPGISYFDDADDGFEGETAYNRVERLAAEEDATIFLQDGPGATERVGPQRVQSLLDILEESAAADGGLLYEHRRTRNLAVRFRSTMYNQPVALTLDYGSGEVAPPLEPVDDDQGVTNVVEVKREGGSSGRAVLREGPLSIQPPPDGIGPVNDSVTLNLASDAQTEPAAHWLLHLGTVDEARYPTVHVMLHAAPHLIPAVLGLDVLDRIQILNPPPWLPPGTIDLLVDGYTETFGLYTWDIEPNCSPGSPWILGEVAAGDGTDGTAQPNRCDTAGSSLVADAAEADTSLLVHAVDGPWVEDPADLPLDVRVGGEVVRATSIGPGVHDDFDRTVTDGWGTSTSGTAWTTTGGAATDYDVNGSQGSIHLAADQSILRFGQVPLVLGDCEQLVSVGMDRTPASATYLPGLFARATTVAGSTQMYWLNFTVDAAGTAGLELRHTVTLAALSGTLFGWSPGDRLWLRMRVDGHRVRGRAWHGATAEPDVWHIDHTITDEIAEGTAGVAVASTDGTTTPLFTYDDYQLLTPQRFEVTRAVNGITKSHTAGADVRLAQPAVTAL